MLLRTNAIIAEWERVASGLDSAEVEIESYIVQHALIVLCAEVQQEIYRIVETRVDRRTEPDIAEFVGKASRKLLRSVGKSELASFVSFFGESKKVKLNEDLDERKVTQYNNAVANRHDVAHKSGVQITLSELKLAVAAASHVLDTIDQVVGTYEKIDPSRTDPEHTS